jgi:hypothetical protein
MIIVEHQEQVSLKRVSKNEERFHKYSRNLSFKTNRLLQEFIKDKVNN